MTYRLSLFATLAAISLLAVGCRPAPQTASPKPLSPPPSSGPTTPPVLPSFPEDPSPIRPRPAHQICDRQNFICVSDHLVNATLPNPFNATGTAIAFESTFQWKITTPSGNEVARGTLMTTAPDVGQPGPFALSTTISPPLSGPHTLTFYESSAKDGSPIHILNIPVQF